MGLDGLTKSWRFWFASALALRLLIFFGMGFGSASLLTRRAADRTQPSAAVSLVDLLNSRTKFIHLTEDEAAYHDIAMNLASGHGFRIDGGWLIAKPGEPTAYAGCGYPLFIASSYFVFGKGNQLPFFLLQILIHSLVVYFVFESANGVAGLKAARIAAAFYTFNPLLIWLSLSMMSEALVGPLLAIYVWLMLRLEMTPRCLPWKLLAALGATLALLAETRSVAVAVLLLSLPLVYAYGRDILSRRDRLARALAVLAVFVALCTPWAVRNYLLWGRWIPFSTKSGTNAYMHNHPGLRATLSETAVSAPMPVDVYSPEIQNLPNEPARDDYLMKLFRDFAIHQPGQVAALACARFLLALLPMPSTSVTSLSTLGAIYAKLPLLLLVLGALVRFRSVAYWRKMTPYWIVLLSWLAIQSLAGPGLRFRSPVDFVSPGVVGVLALALLQRRAIRVPTHVKVRANEA